MENRTNQFQLTIVVPVYNELENIPRLKSEFESYLAKSSLKSCVLFVNDGSKDGSKDAIVEVCNGSSNLFYISFDRNRGLSAAIKAGIDYTFSKYVAYIDADLQTSPDDFELLIPHLAEFQLVTGIRIGRKDTFVKRMSSKIANGFRRFMTGDGIEDTGCPLKIIWTENAKRIPFFKGMHRFIPALMMLQEGVKVQQVGVRHFPRIAGVAKFNLTNRLISPFMDCFAYRWMRSRYINYSVAEDNIK